MTFLTSFFCARSSARGTLAVSAGAFTFRTSNTVEVPAKTGQFITLFASSEIALERPKKLRARVTGEVPNFDFTYDGSTIAAFAPDNNVYSVSKAPGTIDAMLPFIEKETGIHFASADILFSDPYTVLTKGLTSALVVGSDTVQGAPCEHLAFRANTEIKVVLERDADSPKAKLCTFYSRAKFLSSQRSSSRTIFKIWRRQSQQETRTKFPSSFA